MARFTRPQRAAMLAQRASNARRVAVLAAAGGGGGSGGITLPASLNDLTYDSVTTAGLFTTNSIQGFCMKDDGTKIYVHDIGTRWVQSHALSTPFDLTTMSGTAVTERGTAITGGTDYIKCMGFSPDGMKFYASKYGTNGIAQWNLPSAYDLSAITSTPDATQLVMTDCRGFHWSTDGEYFALAGYSQIIAYQCSTPWDISTGVIVGGNANLAATATGLNGVVVADDGLSAIVSIESATAASAGGARFHRYTFSTAWQFDTFTHDATTKDPNAAEPYATCITVHPSRNELYLGYFADPGVDDCIVEKYTW